ncbi:MAG: ABC transporter ATP-binding protein [Desulfobulbaceae bacterium]|nr:ABC transporter ATP-binding protein [Desulfobulbaceae bacterium]
MNTSNPLLSINDLSLAFINDQNPEGLNRVLNNVNLKINASATHALVGESGSGKSVTALSVLRLLEEVSTVRMQGEIMFDGHEMLSLTRKQLLNIRGNQIAMIFQEPMTSLNPVYTVGNQLREPLMQHQKLSKDEARVKALQLLDLSGITQPEYRIDAYPHQLSGGQRQRVMIAMALACRPKLLIADEPTTALDVTIQEQILSLIKDLQQEFNMAVLLITHDLPMVRKIAETVSIMHDGRIVEQGATDAIFRNPQADYTKHLLSSLPHGKPGPAPAGNDLITLDKVHCEFVMKTGTKWLFKTKKSVLKAVDNVSLKIRQGATLGIVGESGSGKSTLGMCLLRLTQCNGTILYHSSSGDLKLSGLSNHAMRPLRKNLQIVFQDPFSSLSPRMSIEQIIGEGLKVHNIGKDKKERRKMVAQALHEVDLEPDMIYRYPHEFSGGQRQRIAIARAIVLKPELLILDEPTSALDMTIQAQIIELLKRLQKRYGMTYIFISHDLRVIRSLANDVAVMQDGRIVECGPAEKIFAKPQHEYTRKLFQAAFLES